MKPSFYYVVPFENTDFYRGKLILWGVPFMLEQDEVGNTMFLLPELHVPVYSQVRSLFGRDFDGTITGFRTR